MLEPNTPAKGRFAGPGETLGTGKDSRPLGSGWASCFYPGPVSTLEGVDITQPRPVRNMLLPPGDKTFFPLLCFLGLRGQKWGIMWFLMYLGQKYRRHFYELGSKVTQRREERARIILS